MNRNKVKGNANEETVKTKKDAGKVLDKESTENKNKVEKQGDKAGAVLREVNGSAAKKTK